MIGLTTPSLANAVEASTVLEDTLNFCRSILVAGLRGGNVRLR